jgi:hypothetical protein
MFWLISYVTCHHLAVALQYGAKYQFYCTVYYINVNSNCKAQRVSKKFEKNVEDRVERQN